MKLIIEEAVSNVVEVQKTVTNLTIAPFDIGLKKLIQVSDSRTISLSDNLTLTDSDYTVQFVDPGGADRNIALPSVGSGNHAFFVVNTADADENLNIKSGSTTLETLAQGQSAMFISNGATWILWRSIPSDYQDGLDGWNLVSDTWSYSASNKITVPSGAQSKYPNYCKIRWKQGGAFKYAYAKATSDTELTIYAGSDYSVANSAITDVYYSVSECPLAFPQWFNYIPSTTNLTGGSIDVAQFNIYKNLCHVRIQYTAGAIGGDVTISTPVTGYSVLVSDSVGQAVFRDAGTALYDGVVILTSTTTLSPKALNAAATYLSISNISSTIPFTWTTNDQILMEAAYRLE